MFGPREQVVYGMVREEIRRGAVRVDFPYGRLGTIARDLGLAHAQLTHAKPPALF